MKKYNRLSILFLFAYTFFLLSCNSEMPWDKEQYENEIYVLSDRSTRVYAGEYHYDGSTGEKTISFLASGSRTLDRDVTITIGEDDVLFDRYNKLNFDVDESKYAKKLEEGSMFTFVTKEVTMKAGEMNVQLPVKVHQETIERISPDSIYFIPVAIRKVSDYVISPEYYNMLFRVYARNDYASQLTRTTYRVRGKRDLGTGTGERDISAEGKVYEPISVNEVRTLAGVIVYDGSEEKIIQCSMVIRINEDHTLQIRTFNDEEPGLIVEQLQPVTDPADPDRIYDNTYDPENKRFKMYYRYKVWTVIDEGKATERYEYSDWVTMKEISMLTTELD